MKCSSCGSEVDVANVFPGGSVMCACGAKATVGAIAPSMAKPPARIATKVAPEVKPSGACPRCSGPLNKRTVEETIADVCIAGDGLFVDHDHLATLREQGQASSSVATSLDRGGTREEAETRYLACPKCGERMKRQAAGGGIVVDVCAKHGTWFDAGELKAALRAKPPAATEEKKDPARATLDVALALEQSRDEEDFRRAVDVAEDVMDTFNFWAFGRDSLRRRRF